MPIRCTYLVLEIQYGDISPFNIYSDVILILVYQGQTKPIDIYKIHSGTINYN